MATQTWDQFEKEYQFKRQFGEAAFKELKKIPLNHDQVKNLINFVKDPKTEAALNKQVEQAFKMAHTPRAGNTHSEATQQIKKQNKQSFKTPRWGKNFEPAIQVMVDTFIQQFASDNTSKPLTQQYNNVLKQMLRHRAELKLRATPKPQPGNKPRPEPR